jgi:glycosyltransferase involved in cell wall biosynthesis/PHP family Zn ribbon phosphoesterase
MESKVDLHVHSKYSEHPSEWFLQRLGAAESYTEPEFIYDYARQNGMRFVTITDHNRIEGVMKIREKYPDDVFTGVETTTYFPEDGCKIHILIYGLTESQFKIIQEIRKSIYDLREYIKENDIAYSVAHATYSVNGKLTINHLEKLILLFDIFESINGGRNKINNDTWTEMLKNLTPLHIGQLSAKHSIETFSNTPWVKGFTGGSDDHAGIFIGRTCTLSNANNIDEFLEDLKRKKTYPLGRHNDYQALAFTIYKIACDFLNAKSDSVSSSLFHQIEKSVFKKTSSSWKKNFNLKKIKHFRKNGNNTQKLFLEFIEKLKNSPAMPIEEKFNILYDKISDLSDELFKNFTKTIENNIKKGDIINIFGNIFSFLPSIFLSVPFLTSLYHMHNTRNLVDEVRKRYLKNSHITKKKVLWFTDTLTDLNGVAVTLKKIGWVASETNKNITIATSLMDREITKDLPPNILNIPCVYHFKLPYYEKYVMKVPSLLKSLKMISRFEPDEIIISTLGPIGLLGLLIAKYLNVKCVGVYHTDFSAQVKEIADDESICNIIEGFSKWFYSSMDEIRVPTREYMDILENRGFNRFKMKLFKRGIDSNLFFPRDTGKSFIKEKFNITDGINLLFAGRISKDKNLDFLSDVYEQILNIREDINLIIVGDGPYLQGYREKMQKFKRVVFTGQVDREILPEIYSGSDLFVFPSTTDTFGMVVLEAQACGLPAIVSDIGGPKEIIIDGKTGYVVKASSLSEWTERIKYIIDLISQHNDSYMLMRETARHNVSMNSSWNSVIQDLLGENEEAFEYSPVIKSKFYNQKPLEMVA